MKRLVFPILVALGLSLIYQPASAQTLLTKTALVEEVPGEFRAPPVGSTFTLDDDVSYQIRGVRGIEVDLRSSTGNSYTFLGWFDWKREGEVGFDVSKFERFFPLEVGKKMEQKMRYVAEGANIPSRVQYEVLRTETITVPAGEFFTYVIRQKLTIFGYTGNETAESTKWYSPTVGLIVKREERGTSGRALGSLQSGYELQRLLSPSGVVQTLPITEVAREEPLRSTDTDEVDSTR